MVLANGGYWARGGIRVQFAPSADDAVVALAGPGVLVVSSDLEVQSGARQRGGLQPKEQMNFGNG